MYINAKMSHKLDAPATLNVVSDGVQMGKRSLKFAASKDHKRFELDLALHADIDPDVSGEKETETPRNRREGGGGGKKDRERRTAFHSSCCCCMALNTAFLVHVFIPCLMSPLLPTPSLVCLHQPSTISFGSVGRVTFTLKKAKGGVKWPKLLDDDQKKPG